MDNRREQWINDDRTDEKKRRRSEYDRKSNKQRWGTTEAGTNGKLKKKLQYNPNYIKSINAEILGYLINGENEKKLTNYRSMRRCLTIYYKNAKNGKRRTFKK